MKDYIRIFKIPESNRISVSFNIEQDDVMSIGGEMNDINELAYMNGYNWEAVLNYYLSINYPDVLENMNSDPEAGSYLVFYELNKENEIKAEKLVSIIENLIENDSMLYELVRNNADKIQWD